MRATFSGRREGRAGCFASGGVFVRKVRVCFICILAMLICMNSVSAFSQAAGGGSDGKSPADAGKNAVVKAIATDTDRKDDAGKQADPQKVPAGRQQIILVKIVGSNGDEMMQVVTDDLVLDVAGCIYEPADRKSPLVIKKNIWVGADNIILADAVIEGDVHLQAGNTTLRNLDVKGTIYIDPVTGKGLKLDNVTADNVSVRLSRQDGAGSETGSCEDKTGDIGEAGGSDAVEADNGNTDITGSTGDADDIANAGGDAGEDARDDNMEDKKDNAGMNSGSQNNPAEAGDSGRNDTSKAAGSDDTGRAGSGAADSGDTAGSHDGPMSRAYLMVADTDSCNSNLVIVNKTRILPAGWKPDDLVRLQVRYSGRAEARYLRKEASQALTELFAAARKDGIELCAVSGFRSYELQQTVFNKHVSQMGLAAAMRVSALPGRSEHQTGLAIDISSKSMGYSLSKSFAHTREGKWLAQNAARFGFILRYPEGKEEITGYDYEPWHFRYVGKDVAMDITEKGLTLEEYFGMADVQGEPVTAASEKGSGA